MIPETGVTPGLSGDADEVPHDDHDDVVVDDDDDDSDDDEHDGPQ
jgi:hypothetical protein